VSSGGAEVGRPRGQRAQEQAYVDRLYTRLDQLQTETAAALVAVRRASGSATPQNRSERDAFAALHEDQLARLRAAEDRLVFGRLDLDGGVRRYLGRLGLSDERREQLLVDWRAPAAEPFYRATAASPQGVVRRRHLTTRSRVVVGIEDEVLDLDALPEDQRATLAGEGALLAALTASRTGRMRDIVATLQAEQDRIVRADAAGVLVVQGGPGTGKTAVALHRAAYLLYTHRDRLARTGVLLVGPNPLFLRYIEQVLPSLGETGVLLSTVGELFPGVTATGTEAPQVAAVKGDLRMVAVLARAVAARQRVPGEARVLDVEGTEVTLLPRDIAAARDRARAGRRPHNTARTGFVADVLARLVQRYARALGFELDPERRRELLADLRSSRDVRREINLAWLPVSPQDLLARLYADPRRLAEAAPELSAEERALLARPRSAPWTPADVALLDEAAELLGPDESADTPAGRAERAAEAERRQELAYARDVLASTGTGPMVSAELLAERYRSDGPRASVAERAAEDRTWAFGHVVVDEAQELSAMTWRLLMRRCPSRSMTLVGDVAQTSSLAGATSWQDVLDPYVGRRWRLETLSINYRTPRRVMELAAGVLAAAGIAAAAPSSVREGEDDPRAVRLPAEPGQAVAALAALVRAELAAIGDGRLAVLLSRSAAAELAPALVSTLPDGVASTGRIGLDCPVAVLAVDAAKGLEFDAVVVVEPADVLADSPRGAHDLYVALTRPTARLRVAHARTLPRALAGLARRDLLAQ